jgi:hypothetical protein
MQSHLIAHTTQIEIMRPEHLVVFEGLAGGLKRAEALTHKP